MCCLAWSTLIAVFGPGSRFSSWYMGKWLIQMKSGIQQSTSQAFTPARVSGGAGGPRTARSPTQNEFPQRLWASCCERWGPPQPFWKFAAFHEHYTWAGHFCLRCSYPRSTCETSLEHLNAFQKSDFPSHRPFLGTFHRNILNIMTVLTSINAGQYFLSWSKSLK